MSEIRFTLYGNDYCHLCHDMVEQLKNFCEQLNLNYQLEWIELDDIHGENPSLYAEYELKIPVLLLNDSEVCHYFLDESLLQELLKIQ